MKEQPKFFDVDGTLADVFKHHTPAFNESMSEIYGESLKYNNIKRHFGNTGKEVLRRSLADNGIDATLDLDKLDAAHGIYVKKLEESIRNSSENIVLPGVITTLDVLKSYDVPMGIVTGNCRSTTEIILEKSGLSGYFKYGINSYGDNKVERKEIVAEALGKAKNEGYIILPEQVPIFGDTINDIIAARLNGCISIIVVKNSFKLHDASVEESAIITRINEFNGNKPDHFIDSFESLEEILSILELPPIS